MCDEVAEQGLIGSDGQQCLLGTSAQGLSVSGGEVGKRIHLGMTPDQFDGVEFRRVPGEQMDMNTMAMLSEPLGRWSAAMSGQAIPDEIHRSPKMPAELLQEMPDCLAIVVGVGQETKVAAHPATFGRDGERGDHGHLAPRAAALGQHRGHSARRPAAPHERGHQEARFIAEDERRTPVGSVFLPAANPP